MRGAPASHGATQTSTRPASKVLIHRVSSAKQAEATGAEDPEVAERRCCTRRREPPGLDPRGKLFRAERTASGSTEMEGGVE